ncbi:MAG: isochorismate synthase [Coriobacteriia bacterium]
MTKIYTKTEPLGLPVLDVFCSLEQRYREKFLYVEKDGRITVAGLGCLVAEQALTVLPHEFSGSIRRSPIMFVAGMFDPDDSKHRNSLFRALEGSTYVLPELVLIEEGGRSFVQVNSTGPIPDGAIETIVAESNPCALRSREIPFTLILDSRQEWFADVEEALRRIRADEFHKIVLARELRVETEAVFTSAQMVANLLAARSGGTLILHEIDGVFFIGATPELLVSKRGSTITTMCLAGTTAAGESQEERAAGAAFLLGDEKNLREHAYVVDHLTRCLSDACSALEMPESPGILALRHVQHLCTPVTGTVAEDVSITELRDRLHPTPALAGSPVEEAKAAIREMEGFNRGFYGGPFGFVDFEGNGEFSVAIRSGVFTRDYGYVYAGCGIVEGSDPAAEYDEIDVKLKTILSAFQGEAR